MAPLVALIIVLGFYPKPLLDLINPAVAATMSDVGADRHAVPEGPTDDRRPLTSRLRGAGADADRVRRGLRRRARRGVRARASTRHAVQVAVALVGTVGALRRHAAAGRHADEVTAAGALAVDGAGAVPAGHDRRARRAGDPADRRAVARPGAVGVRGPGRGAGRQRRATASWPPPTRVQTEVYPLAMFALGGMMLFVAANDLLIMFVALEVLSLPLYLLCGLARRRRLLSQEAALKYFLLGAFASAFFLYGLALVYGFAGSVRLGDDPRRPRVAEGSDILLLLGPGAARRRPAVQGQRRAVPHLDAGRLPGRPDAGHRVHGGLHQGGRVRRAPAGALRRLRHAASGPGGR